MNALSWKKITEYFSENEAEFYDNVVLIMEETITLIVRMEDCNTTITFSEENFTCNHDIRESVEKFIRDPCHHTMILLLEDAEILSNEFSCFSF